MTTPVAYIASIPKDPFGVSAGYDVYKIYGTTEDYFYCRKEYFDIHGWNWLVIPDGTATGTPSKWALESKGPDHAWSQADGAGTWELGMPYVWAYDPTNGTISRGNIVISGP